MIIFMSIVNSYRSSELDKIGLTENQIELIINYYQLFKGSH